MMIRNAVIAALAIAAAACGPTGKAPQATTPNSAPLGAPGAGGGIAEGPQWLCMPDKVDDPCHQDLSTTELLADGTRRVVTHVRATQPKADCFYVYPTVDRAPAPGNHTDFRDLTRERAVTIGQAARFAEHCAMYVP